LFEHPISDDDVAQVPSTGQHGRLMTTLTEPCHLAQPKLASQEPNGLVVEEVLHRMSIELGLAQDEPLFRGMPEAALTVGDEVKIHRQQCLEEFRTPSSTVEDDGHAAVGSD